MQINKYLEKYQPVIYKIFENAIKDNRISHAYLLSGSNGMPLKETALFLAKSILCDSPSPLACGSCMTCIRIDEGNYPDVMVIDGETSKIKKGDIEKVMDNFDKTALEEKGIMIYILHLVETMTPIAVNSLLKFLEEPGNNIYAFLTTENESKVLPTILSRTQILRFRSVPKEEIIKDAVNSGVALEDAEMLCGFYNDGETINKIANDEIYKVAKQALDEQLDALLKDGDEAIYTCERRIISTIKSNDVARLYLKMLGTVFQDLLNLSVNERITLSCYDKILRELCTHLKHIDKSLFVVMSSVSKLDFNVNLPLLLDHVIYQITKEEK